MKHVVVELMSLCMSLYYKVLQFPFHFGSMDGFQYLKVVDGHNSQLYLGPAK